MRTIPFRTGEHKDFDRIVFDAPKGATYKIHRDKTEVVIEFSLPAKVSFGNPKLERAKGFVASGGADGLSPLSVKFSVAPNAAIKDFYSGTSIVIDVTGSAARSVPAAQMERTGQPLPETKPNEVVKAPAETRIISPTPKPPESKVEEKPSENTAQAAVSPAPATFSQPSPPSAQTLPDNPEAIQAAAAKAPLPTIAPAPQPAPVAPVHETEASPPPQPRLFVAPKLAMDPKAIESIQKIVAESPPTPVAVLDPKLPIGAAIFTRGGYVTIVFDRKLAGDSLISSPAPRVKLEPLELPYNTGFRIAVPDGVSARATRRDNAWEIFLVKAGAEAALSTDFVAQPEFALGARLLVVTGSPPAPFFFPDPVVGDDLIVLPLRETGAFTAKRRLSDFQVIPAAQGLVIKPMHERVVARIVPDGVEISAEGGLKLSPQIDTGADAASPEAAKAKAKLIYAFDKWRGMDGSSFIEMRQKLMRTIVDIKEEERVLARLDLARFYFAYGMGNEALAILSVIQSKLPEIETHPDFLSVRGGAKILTGHFQEGLNDLSHPSLRDQAEVTLWKAVASAGLRDWAAAYEQFVIAETLLPNYPEPFRSRFNVLAVESAAASGKDQKVSEWLTALERMGYDSAYEPAIRYLRGIVYSKAGRSDMAEKLWRQVVRGGDRLYKIRAELALVDLGVATKSLTPKQAVERLEGLRFAWRGDDLEFDILKRLGGFYFDAKNFKMGFQVLSQALRLFPNAPATPALREEMVRTFRDVFLTDMGAALSPIDALSLYTDYKALIPAGEEGNAVRRNLAERLIDIDLLDQAAKLLEDLMKHSSKTDERVRTATRLAAVRLLDHKADAAIAYLDQSKEEAATLSGSIQDERLLLRARALSEMGKYTDAVAILPNNNSKATNLLKADMAMRAKNWGDATKALMDLIGAPEPEKPMDEEKASWIVNAALSMARAGDIAGLDKLADDFGENMDRTSKGNLFRVLTRPEKMAQMKDIRSAQARLSEVDMFKSVLDSYRTSEQK